MHLNRRRLIGTALAASAATTTAATTTSATAADPPNHVRRTADLAMDRFDDGWRTGDWEPFLAMLTDSFSFWFPEDPARGRFEGAQGRRVVEEWARFHAAAGNRVLGRRDRTHVIGDRVFYTYESRGTSPTTEAYRNWEVIVVEVRGDRISALHEYWGDARPAEAP